MTVVELDTRRLRSADFACGERLGDGSWPITTEAWTQHPLDEVLRDDHRTMFLAPLTHFCRAGDRLEVFQVTDIERPERDPVAMVPVTVTGFTTDRHGMHLDTQVTGQALYFGSATGKSIEEKPWRGKQCVFKDGWRVGAFNTLIEAVECAERLRDPKNTAASFEKRVNTRLAELRKVKPATVSLPVSHRCRREDIAYAAPKKISREMAVRVLDPIADVLADPAYFSRVVSCFRTGDRVSFTSFDSDAYATVVEILPLALVDVSANRLRLYPQSKILATRYERETGWARETIKGRVHLRKDGRTVETFANDERCDWHCADHGIEAVEIWKAA